MRVILLSLFVWSVAHGTDLPEGFEERELLAGLVDPAVMAFAPDGRLFIGERIQGRLRVAHYDARNDCWTLQPQPFHTFDIPHDGTGTPERHRSSGLRGFAFDPAFETNGFLYCFYMKHAPRHNRLVRIQASAADPDVADPVETLLFEMPFNGSESSGSHNGGAVCFGGDGLLYVTTGDGWNGGDTVQSLSTFTGKVFRLAPDGTIPEDNPFSGEADGDFRAIYALGLRNPFSMSRHPLTGALYVNDVAGSNKANVYALAPGANYGHDGYGGIGDLTGAWADAGLGGSTGRVASGGAWHPYCGAFPAAYHGSYFTSMWGGNGAPTGSITVVTSDADPTVRAFATGIGFPDPAETLRPMSITIDPLRGTLVYLASSYEADDARILEIRPNALASPDIDADGVVGLSDLLALLANWGACPTATPCVHDLDGDCEVALSDLLRVLAGWT